MGSTVDLCLTSAPKNRKQRVHPRRQAPQTPRAAPFWWGPRVSSCSWGLNQCLPSQGQNLRYRYNHLECFNRTLTINETRSIHTVKQSPPIIFLAISSCGHPGKHSPTPCQLRLKMDTAHRAWLLRFPRCQPTEESVISIKHLQINAMLKRKNPFQSKITRTVVIDFCPALSIHSGCAFS